MSDEPLIPFNLTHYADLIDRQAKDFVAHYGLAYRSLNFNFGDPSKALTRRASWRNDLDLQTTWRLWSLNWPRPFDVSNQKSNRPRSIGNFSDRNRPLDRLTFLVWIFWNDWIKNWSNSNVYSWWTMTKILLLKLQSMDFSTSSSSRIDLLRRHLLFGSAFGFTNTIVPFPSLSNLLFDVPTGFQTELADTSKVRWSKLKEHVQLMQRTLDGFDGFRSPAPHHWCLVQWKDVRIQDSSVLAFIFCSMLSLLSSSDRCFRTF